MHLRMLGPDDIEKCVALYIDVFNRPPWNNEWTPETARRLVHDLWHTPGFRGYAAIDETQDDSPVAAVLGKEKQWWKGTEFWIEEFFVRPDSQGQGIGSRLLAFVCADLRDRGIDQAVLLTDKSAPAFAFYTDRGFREHATLRLLHTTL
ncbi:GNAT family N-acetyltransferase [Paenibacillus cymbidii]|uniref:GNAT family N-acetyltransferase n=1 Tax=Paenibacillus cymbidii TaxID=1639034 RepID=UPI0014369070|nr:GNAT family N-acetyltransferase [Paenibacillus cymbidii]